MQMQSSSLTLNEQSTEESATQTLQKWLVNQLAEQLSLEPESINITEPLTRYGLDSIDAVTLVGDLEDWLELDLPDTLFWDHPTIEKASLYLAENFDLSAELANTKEEKINPPVPETPKTTQEKEKTRGGLWGRLTGG